MKDGEREVKSPDQNVEEKEVGEYSKENYDDD